MSLLHLDGVHSYYGHIHALKGISLTVEEGAVQTQAGDFQFGRDRAGAVKIFKKQR